MKNLYIIIFLLTLHFVAKSQELFVASEPASNMPANSFGVRIMNTFMREKSNSTVSFHTMPELMYGISNKWMVHLQTFKNKSAGEPFSFEGGSIYVKNRFFSSDDLHTHFRMASFARYSFNRAKIHQEEIETMGHNSGLELGLIATKLLHKTAISSTLSFEQALNNTSINKIPSTQSSNATNLSLSFGQLLSPKKYTSYKQTNINVMLELVAQYLNQQDKGFIDVVPSLQFIIHSKARVDIAYKQELYSHCIRTAPNGLWLKLEYNIFNAF